MSLSSAHHVFPGASLLQVKWLQAELTLLDVAQGQRETRQLVGHVRWGGGGEPGLVASF